LITNSLKHKYLKLRFSEKSKAFEKSPNWFRSHHLHLQWKLKLFAGKFTWGNKKKHCWLISTNLFFSKVCWQIGLSKITYSFQILFKLGLKILLFCCFPHDVTKEIESRLTFKIFSTLFSNVKTKWSFFKFCGLLRIY
jgi:hypothetical protein